MDGLGGHSRPLFTPPGHRAAIRPPHRSDERGPGYPLTARWVQSTRACIFITVR
jgi:hypothetical protein